MRKTISPAVKQLLVDVDLASFLSETVSLPFGFTSSMFCCYMHTQAHGHTLYAMNTETSLSRVNKLHKNRTRLHMPLMLGSHWSASALGGVASLSV